MSFKNRVENNVEQEDILGIREGGFDIGISGLIYNEDIQKVYKAQKENILAALTQEGKKHTPPLRAMEYVSQHYKGDLDTTEEIECATVKLAVEIVAKEIEQTFKNQQKN